MILSQLPPNFYPTYSSELSSKKLSQLRIVKRFYGSLYQEGEMLNEIFFLLDGKVSLFKKDICGRKVKLPGVDQGKFLGLRSFCGQNRVSHSARVSKSSILLVIPLVQLSGLLKRWPILKEQLISQLIQQTDLLEEF